MEDWIIVERKNGKREKRYHVYCSCCLESRGYQIKANADKKCQSCRSRDTFSKRSKDIEHIQSDKDGRRKHKTYCSKCGRDRGFLRLRDHKRICSFCNSPRFSNGICKKIANGLRCRLNKILKKRPKAGSAVNLLGCSLDTLKTYLESLWQPGMSWDNWSKDGWHIDHIRPLASFNLTDIEQLKQACHYTNLQPLWAKDNLVKSSKWEGETDDKQVDV